MSAVALLARVRSYGVELRAVADTLQCRPRDSLPPTIVAELRRHKRAILALLAADDPAVAERVAAMRARHHPTPGPSPFLTIRDVPRDAIGCRSCGEPLAETADGPAIRCHSCVLAALLILEEGRNATETERNRGFLDPGRRNT